jgi:hypothetical protein
VSFCMLCYNRLGWRQEHSFYRVLGIKDINSVGTSTNLENVRRTPLRRLLVLVFSWPAAVPFRRHRESSLPSHRFALIWVSLGRQCGWNWEPCESFARALAQLTAAALLDVALPFMRALSGSKFLLDCQVKTWSAPRSRRTMAASASFPPWRLGLARLHAWPC